MQIPPICRARHLVLKAASPFTISPQKHLNQGIQHSIEFPLTRFSPSLDKIPVCNRNSSFPGPCFG